MRKNVWDDQKSKWGFLPEKSKDMYDKYGRGISFVVVGLALITLFIGTILNP